jgi:hypothetical protein
VSEWVAEEFVLKGLNRVCVCSCSWSGGSLEVKWSWCFLQPCDRCNAISEVKCRGEGGIEL